MRIRRVVFQLGAALAVSLPLAHEAAAIDKLVFEAEEISTAGAKLTNVEISLDLTQGPAVTTRIRADRANVDALPSGFRNIDVTCADLVVKEPVFGCRDTRITAKGGPTDALALRSSALFDSKAGSLTFQVNNFALANGQIRMDGSLVGEQWTINARGTHLDTIAVRKFVSPWVTVPTEFAFGGHADLQLKASSKRKQRIQFDASLSTTDFGFSNEESTLVTEYLIASLNVAGTTSPDGISFNTHLTGTSGQALAGPVLLNFKTNPLDLKANGTFANNVLNVKDLTIAQAQLLNAKGTAQIRLGEKPSVVRARVDIGNIELPAAYVSLAQITLATTDFSSMQTSGKASGAIEIADNKPVRVDLRLDNLNFDDTRGKYALRGLFGDVHWMPDERAAVSSSYLKWNYGAAYGLHGGAARLDFLARGLGFELTKESRLPVLDGAIVVKALSTRQLGKSDVELNFDAMIEPISMPLLSKSFGWPDLQGSVSGRVPGLSYRNKELTMQGDLSATVFDGTIIGKNFRLRDPLGPWPRLFADVNARRLDLELVTRTFPIGSITGRLDADLSGLELFNWSPVAFDARLYTSPGDRSKHLISQKAVTSISNVGGGGGGVSAALQSGVLQFFDDFKYDRIGITCKLKHDVCLMGGVEPAGIGYYLVKGSGLPRINIIGNQGRVDYPLLVSQIVAGMDSNNLVIK